MHICEKKISVNVLTKSSLYDIIFGYAKYDPLAQSVEHLTFNQGVRDSSSRWVTKNKRHCDAVPFVFDDSLPLTYNVESIKEFLEALEKVVPIREHYDFVKWEF